jgi:hypothetical protein
MQPPSAVFRRFLPIFAFAVAGSLVGYYWKDLSALVRPPLATIAALWANFETYVAAHPGNAGLIFALVGALILPTWNLSGAILRRLLRRKSIIDMIFANEDHVHMVTAHMRQTSFERIGTSQVIHLPSNAPFLPSSVAIGGALIYSYAHQRYGSRKTAWLHFDNDNWGADTHNFIAIGGPFVNEFAKEIVERKKIPGFALTDIPTATDGTDKYVPDRETLSKADAPLLTDYGFIVYTKNPRNHQKRVCLAFGLWPPGTQAAVAVLLDPAARPRANRNKLRKAIRKDKSVIAIVKVNINGLFLEEAELLKVREF